MATYKISGLTLHTSFDQPPIPTKAMDWSCIDDNYEGAPDSDYHIVGTGETEIEAIYNYLAEYVGNGFDK